MTCPFLTKSRVFQHTEKSISEQHVNLVFGKNSLVAQLVKNLPAARETWVQFLGQEDPLEKGCWKKGSSKKDSWNQGRRLWRSGQGGSCIGNNTLAQRAAVGKRGFAFVSQGRPESTLLSCILERTG